MDEVWSDAYSLRTIVLHQHEVGPLPADAAAHAEPVEGIDRIDAPADVEVGGRRRIDGLAPVSYTHLDVYKRQLIKQYTNAVNTFSSALELNPSNPFLYLNRSTTRAEMIDFCLLYTSRCV